MLCWNKYLQKKVLDKINIYFKLLLLKVILEDPVLIYENLELKNFNRMHLIT